MASVALPFERHHMVRADPSAWAGMLAGRGDLADEPLLTAWAERGWPLIARRPSSEDVLGAVPALYEVALPTLRSARRLAPDDPGAARVQACMGLIATVEDSNLLYRGGLEGLAFARGQARRFLDEDGVGSADWRARATTIHEAFVARRLSPGGCADLLAMALFVDGIGA